MYLMNGTKIRSNKHMKLQKSSMLIIGLGFSGQAIAHTTSMSVLGLNRRGQGGDIATRALDLLAFNHDEQLLSLTDEIKSTTHLVMSIAPNETGDLLLSIGAAKISALLPHLKWIGYLSTVGVYGDNHGSWVDEMSPLAATSKRGVQRILAERQWQQYAFIRKVPLAIFRLAGIYGPGRSTLEKLKQGKARVVEKPGQVFNRIHVTDIANIVSQMADQNMSGIYNMCDDLPAPPHEVTEFAADLLGMQPPPRQLYSQADMSPMARSFYDDNKRISNLKVKQALDYHFVYPTYMQGLKGLLD